MKKLLVPSLLLLPALAGAQTFGPITGGLDAANGLKPPAVATPSGTFAGVTDSRDTLKSPPPAGGIAAPVGGSVEAAESLAPLPVANPPSPVLPPLVKRNVPQRLTETEPGVMVIQPADRAPPPAAQAVTAPSGLPGTPDLAPDPKGTFSFGGNDGPPYMPPRGSEVVIPAGLLALTPVTEPDEPQVSPTAVPGEHFPVRIISPSGAVVTATAPVSLTQVSATAPAAQPAGPMAASLSFWADDLTLSATAKKQLSTFVSLARAQAPLRALMLTQRTVAPLNALSMLADARRQTILEELKRQGVINKNTLISEVRVRSTAPRSKLTLVGN